MVNRHAIGIVILLSLVLASSACGADNQNGRTEDQTGGAGEYANDKNPRDYLTLSSDGTFLLSEGDEIAHSWNIPSQW